MRSSKLVFHTRRLGIFFADALRCPYVSILRPRQWTKNLIVFAAPLFDFSLDTQNLLASTTAFALFCLMSSSFYIINDVWDVDADRRHPVKSRRPIPSGLISIPAALALATALLSAALLIGALQSPALGASLLLYALLQGAYNLQLKHAPIADILAIATGFILRVCAGAAATNIAPSPWLLLCTAMLALFLAIEKRKAEIRLTAAHGFNQTRRVMYRYSLPLLSRMESTATSGAVISYALWSAGPSLGGATTPWMLLTLPFVLYCIFRYQLLSDPDEISRRFGSSTVTGRSSERPEDLLFSDLPMLASGAMWALSCLLILYLTR